MEEKVQLGEREFYANPSVFIAEELVAHGVEIAFGVQGGHVWQICDEMSRHGIQMITVRHEQNAVYMAENYARMTRKPAIVYATAGPGMTNLVTAVNQAYLAKAPIILILGSHEVEHDGLYTTIQEAYASDLLGGVTKWTQRITQSNQIKHFIARAFKDALTYPYAPVALEFTADTMIFNVVPPQGRIWELNPPHGDYVPNWRGKRTGQPITTGGDPALIDEAVDLIYQAKNPLIMAGDGIHWCDGSRELIEFAEYARIPVSGRRTGRGAVPETHPLALSSRSAAAIQKDVDLTIALGMKVGFFDGYGGGWKRVIQINESCDQIWSFLPTEVAIVGTPKVVLKQMLECARAKNLNPPPERQDWIGRAAGLSAKHLAGMQERAEKYKDLKPLHPGYIAKVISDVCEQRYGGQNHVVIDGFTISGFAPHFFRLKRSAQMTDASEQAGVGHGIGMAMGVAFADPSTKKCPVVSLMGDAGMGNAGMEIETALRYKLPVVFVVTNNDGWLAGMRDLIYGEKWEALKNEKNQEWGLSDFVPDQRYDKMFEIIGCHGEWVTDPKDMKEALHRSFDAAEKGIPAVLNVKMSRRVAPTVTHQSPVYALCWHHIPWDELPKRGKYIRSIYLQPAHPAIPTMEAKDPWEPISDDEVTP